MIQSSFLFSVRTFFASMCLGVLLFSCAQSTRAQSVGGIDTSAAGSGYAWSNVGGWVNFGTVEGDVTVTDTGITGYAWDGNYGWLNLAPSAGGVTNDGEGNLGGNAWSIGGGWISFDGITIDDEGVFRGVTATSPSYGKVSFDCMYCDVVTTWRKASVRAANGTTTGVSGGVIPPQGPVPSPLAPPTMAPIALSQMPAAALSGTQIATTSRGLGKVLPERLFDIRLIVDRRQVFSASELVARTTFESFGRVQTTVALTFSIRDASGAEVYAKKDAVVIETEGVLVTRFESLDLPVGVYTLNLQTVYNTDVTDDFAIPFEIVAPSTDSFPWWWVLVIVAVLGIFFLIFFWKRRRDEKDVQGPQPGAAGSLGV